MAKKALIFIVAIIFYSCSNKKTDKSINYNNVNKEAIIDSILKFEYYEGKYESLTGKITEQWRYYEQLAKRYSEDELEQLCYYGSPIIKCLAFTALTEKCSSKVFKILLSHLTDTTEFGRFYGCSGGSDRVTDNFLEVVGYNKNYPTKFTLTGEQFNYIDSVLLYGEEIKMRSRLGSIELRSRRYLIERLKPAPQYYNRIKDLVINEVYEAIPILAKYKYNNDTSIFKKLLRHDEFSNKGRNLKHYVRSSIVSFPHPSFYQILKEQLLAEVGTNSISDSYESFPLYIALVQYPTKETVELFNNSLKASVKEEISRSRSIHVAINLYPSKVFDSLKVKVSNIQEEIIKQEFTQLSP